MNSKDLQARFFAIRSNRFFEFFVISVIIFSALVIGAKTYDVSPNILQLIRWLDIGITLFFMVEIVIRFIGDPNKRSFFKDPWNLFDTLIVVVSLVPIDDREMALVGRLIRIFRVLRMVSIIPELRMLLNSLIKAMPQLGYVILLMFIIFYIYAAAGASLFAHINEDLWGDITISLLTLFRVMTFEDWTDVMYETMEVYPLSWIYYLTFIFLTAFAFLNMVIGIVVNVMESESSREAKEKAEAKAASEPSLTDLQNEIKSLRQLIEDKVK